jgi:hypothetical protein
LECARIGPQALPRGSAAATTINHLDGQFHQSGFRIERAMCATAKLTFPARCARISAKLRLSIKHQRRKKVSVIHLALCRTQQVAGAWHEVPSQQSFRSIAFVTCI